MAFFIHAYAFQISPIRWRHRAGIQIFFTYYEDNFGLDVA